jgi:hypothetical protein
VRRIGHAAKVLEQKGLVKMKAEKPDPVCLEKHLTTRADTSLMSDTVYHLSFT